MTQFKKDLNGKVAIVTGSSRGLGAAIAKRLAAHGADVVINYNSSANAAEEVASDIRRTHGVRSIVIKADISDDQDVIRLFDEAKDKLGRIDVVMSNAGIEHFGNVESISGAEIDYVFSVNVKGQFFVAQQASRHMEDGGRLILMSSMAAVMGVPRHAIYAASKAAVTGLVKCLAWDLGVRNITVNCVAPGGVKGTDMYRQNANEYFIGEKRLNSEEVDTRVAMWSPLRRLGMPDDVAGAVALLCSEEAGWITGQTIHVGGGAHMATS